MSELYINPIELRAMNRYKERGIDDEKSNFESLILPSPLLKVDFT